MSEGTELFNILRCSGPDEPVFLLGTIPDDYVSGRPKVKFDGETSVGSRTYPYLENYIPTAGDRVLVAVVGHGCVILGKIV